MIEFAKSLCVKVGGLLSIAPLYAGIILLAVALIVLVSVVAIIVAIVKNCKKQRAQAKATKQALKEPVESVVDIQALTPTQTEAVKEKEKTEEKQQQKVEEKAKAPNTAEKQVKKEKTKQVKASKKLNGKWVIEIKSADEYIAKLLASNGEIMLTSEIYSSEEGAIKGIATISKWVETGKFVIYQDKNKNFYYKLKTSGNRLLCVGEIYKSEEQCLKAVETVKRIAQSSPVSDKISEGAKYIDYTPQELNLDAVKKGLKGKWKIEKLANKHFSAKLYASNGQLMIATEEVAIKKSVVNAIESVKKNAQQGNFIIDKDKFGRFYYKLRNAQKSIICIGEAYDSLDSCISAIESVRRFAINSSVVDE